MELKFTDLSGEMINNLIVKAVAESAIGEQLEKTIKEVVAKISRSYDNPVEIVIENEIHAIIRKILLNDFATILEEQVKAKMASKITSEVIDKLWDKALTKWMRD